MLIGHARVSTEHQNLYLQRDALEQAGCEQMFTDKVTGTDKVTCTKAKRPGVEQALSPLRAGYTLVVWRLDRGLAVPSDTPLTPLQGFTRKGLALRASQRKSTPSVAANRFFISL